MNYRPVSLTSVICKVFESLMRDTIVSFLEQRELLRTRNTVLEKAGRV